jgi:serine/threonine protein kinase
MRMTSSENTEERLRAAIADLYQVEGEIGSGGMATVYLAQDLKHDRKVAVKVLRPELSASIGAERFLREIQISAKLNHPHILTLIDSGEADGLLYYVMPYVEGESLRDRREREGQLPLDEAFKIVREVADGLGYAHRLDIVHRDTEERLERFVREAREISSAREAVREARQRDQKAESR